MKQRTRLMNHGDDLASYNMINSKKDDGDDHEIQLQRMKQQEHYIEAQIEQGDTLQAIALRFYCSLSELKRINHIHKDNEIFARRTIKVPITPYSVLTERIPIEQGVELVPSTSTQTSTFLQELTQNHSNQQNSGANLRDDNDCSIDCNAIVLNSTLTPAVKLYKDIEPAEQVSEDTLLLPNKEKDKTSVEAVIVKQLTSQGADFGLKWYHLVSIIFILCLLVPLWIVLFKIDKQDIEHPDLSPLST